MAIPREVMADGVIAVLSRVMSYIAGVDIANGKDAAVIMDWAILENGSAQLVKAERIERA